MMTTSSANSKKISCSVEILTRNSAETLERCLGSVKDFAEIIILDGNSIDRTLEIAKSHGCKIYKQYETNEPEIAIKDYSEVRNKGLRLASHEWFLYIDADEYLSSETAEEIRSIVENPKPEFFVWWQPRKYILDGKVVDCATTYPNQQIRFFHRAWVERFIKPIHERIEVKPDVDVGWLRHFEYVPVGSLESLRLRWEKYIKLEEGMLGKMGHRKLFWLAIRQVALFFLYTGRYLRGALFCRGVRLPFIYEWTRHKYTLKLAFVLFRNAFFRK